MRKYIILILGLIFSVNFLFAQEEKMLIHNNGNVMFESVISEIDSIKFRNNISYINLINGNMEIPVSEIDSITFTQETIEPTGNIVYIFYNNENITIINPFENRNVNVTTESAHVTVNSTINITDIEYHISGNTENGSLTFYSEESATLTLSNISMINPSGIAINITSNTKTSINLADGSSNYLSDGTPSAGNSTLLCEGEIIFSGTGKLSLEGYKKHGISSSSSITINNGTITILKSASDGFHSESFIMNNGSLNITSDSDAIDAGAGTFEINNGTIKITSTKNDVKGIKSDDNLTINNGIIEMTISGAQSKGLSSKKNIIFNGGSTKIICSGITVLESSGNGYDPSYCTAAKSKGDIIINNGTINIECTTTNDGGKGLSADGNIEIVSGNIHITTAGNGSTYTNEEAAADSYTSCCIKSDGNITIIGGNIICSSTGNGGKGISADGELIIGSLNSANDLLTLNVSTSGERFYVSGSGNNADYANPKAIKSEGNLTVNSGDITISCTQSNEGGEGLESKSTLTINGGSISISAYDDCINASDHIEITNGNIYCVSSGNDAIDSNGTLTISGGFINANGTSSPEAGIDCDQSTFKITGGIIVSTGGSTSNPTQNVSSQYSIIYNNATPGNSIHIKNSANETILLLELPTFSGSGSGLGGPGGGNNRMVVLFSDPNLAPGSYTLEYGGTISGGTTVNGYNTGGTYSGGSTKTFNISSMVTTVN